MKTNGSGNFFGTLQRGNEVRYIGGGNSETTVLPQITSGAVGSGCSGATPTWAAQTIRGTTGSAVWIPPTANIVDLVGTGTIIVAPNASYPGTTPTLAPTGTFLMEANTIQACGAGGSALYAYGWKERVNAN
jgi:hypothetical protein